VLGYSCSISSEEVIDWILFHRTFKAMRQSTTYPNTLKIKINANMRSTEWLPVARPMLGRYRSLPSVAPRLPIGDRGRWEK